RTPGQDVRLLVIGAADDGSIQGRAHGGPCGDPRDPAHAFRPLAASLPPDSRSGVSPRSGDGVRRPVRDDRAGAATAHIRDPGRTAARPPQQTGRRRVTPPCDPQAVPEHLALLPPGVRPYLRTDTFTEAATPSGLLGSHATKDGTWGL